MNNEKCISSEESSIQEFIDAAIYQYNNDNHTPNIIPPDYHVLFILAKSVSSNGVIYSTNSYMEDIFERTVVNFKGTVEAFSNNNVHIVTTTKIINDTVYTSQNYHYLVHANIYDYLKKYSSVGLYDAVIVLSAPTQSGTSMTSLDTFQYECIMHGFSHVKIDTEDTTKLISNPPSEYPYLITTNRCIHEWMHQLAGGYRNNIATIYPDTHGYQNPSNYGYVWNKNYFDDITQYPYIVEHFDRPEKLTSYYRAVLAGEVTYTKVTPNRQIGVFPLFWKITPRKLVIGRYLIQDNSGNYYYNNTTEPTPSSSFTNEMKYIWNIYYSFNSNTLIIRNYHNDNAGYVTITDPYSAFICTRVGPYDEGEYCLVNITLGYSVLGYTSSKNLNTVSYRSNNMQTFKLEYYSELYFSLLATQLTGEYLDLYNNVDNEDQSVHLYGWSTYYDAQTWQYRFDGTNYKIMPKKSPTRSLSFHNNSLHITSVSNIQNWRPELISNGKIIREGTYKIKTLSGQYLTFTGNTLKLSNNATTWNFTPLGDNYYSISAQSGSTTYYFDVLNTYDSEGNIVQVQYFTGYLDAQSWKLMWKNDGSVIIVPRVSLNRGIKSTTSGSTLSTSYTKFYLEI